MYHLLYKIFNFFYLKLNLKKMEENIDISPLCKYCFEVLESALSNKDIKKIPFPEEFKGKSFPLFVTWTLGKDK